MSFTRTVLPASSGMWINAVDSNIKFTQKYVRGNSLSFLDCTVHCDRNISINTKFTQVKGEHSTCLIIQIGTYQNHKNTLNRQRGEPWTEQHSLFWRTFWQTPEDLRQTPHICAPKTHWGRSLRIKDPDISRIFAVQQHLKEKRQSLEDNNGHLLA